MMKLMIPARIATSSPGRGWMWMAARAAVCDRRGSITISFIPRRERGLAASAPGFWPGMPMALDTSGLVPISIQLSAS